MGQKEHAGAEVREERAKLSVGELAALGRRCNREQGSLRLKKDALTEQITERNTVLESAKTRVKQVRIELGRVRKHAGKWVNCDVWNPGVMQVGVSRLLRRR